ncbi:MAG: hypothetical protein M1820_000337 [Bogoriella megaspora]|nr:MAG: hypothetical protein M1820_000337 [Bogoriella megaspora]
MLNTAFHASAWHNLEFQRRDPPSALLPSSFAAILRLAKSPGHDSFDAEPELTQLVTAERANATTSLVLGSAPHIDLSHFRDRPSTSLEMSLYIDAPRNPTGNTSNFIMSSDPLEQLIAGFEALKDDYKKLLLQHQDLEAKLSFAKNQINDLETRLSQVTRATGKPPRSGTNSTLEECDREGARTDLTRAAEEAVKKLRGQSVREYSEGVRIWKGPSADRAEVLPAIKENHVEADGVMEQDFTIPGTPSKLGCPFAAMAGRPLSSHAASVVSRYRSSAASRSSLSRFTPQANRSRRPSIEDPIRADVCGLDKLAGSASPTPSAAVCPIRFLDQHKPEEIAQYFEKHKHELPRSHEVCVKRYQSNEESIRQLDAKYGNLVSMIQGLGAKHQPMLPETPPLEDDVSETESLTKIQKWARTVSVSLEGDEIKVHEEGLEETEYVNDDRLPHFDRPLKDIRVGESPSRPWGINVPPKYEENASLVSSKPAEITSPQPEPETVDIAHCPFQARQRENDGMQPQTAYVPQVSEEKLERSSRDNQPRTVIIKSDDTKETAPQMLFTGPVFIGYPMEQALSLLKQSQKTS